MAALTTPDLFTGDGNLTNATDRGRGGAESRMPLVIGALVFAGLIPLLAYAPYWFETRTDIVSAAAAEGYSSNAAYFLAICWFALGFAITCLMGTRFTRRVGNRLSEHHPPVSPSSVDLSSSHVRENRLYPAIIVSVVMAIAFFPPFLSATGPFFEDHLHLNALHRMLGGQRPYVDFEFLYGPLILYPAYWWIRMFGYSLMSFYTYVALVEAVHFGILAFVVWSLVRQPRWRLFALAVLGLFWFNALVGPNWSGSRRLLGLLGLLLISARPTQRQFAVGGGALLGLQLAYSHDFGVSALAGAGAIYALLCFLGTARAVSAGLETLGAALLTWLLVAGSLMRNGLSAYVTEVIDLSRRFSIGEAGFTFYWTANSLAVFALLTFACVSIAWGLATRRGVAPTLADLLLLGGFVFALVDLKAGLNRADLWHLNAAMYPVIVAFLIREGHRRFAYSVSGRKLVAILLVVAAGTSFFGVLPAGSPLAKGWWNGAIAALQQAKSSSPASLPVTPAPILASERLTPGTPWHELANLFARDDWYGRSVLLYSDAWALGKFFGVYKSDYVNDDSLFSDERGYRVRDFLIRNPDAIVLMNAPVYERLYGLRNRRDFPEHNLRVQPTPAKRIASWMSTPHYRALEVEIRLKDERWRRTVGEYLAARYRPYRQIGRVVVLAPTAHWPDEATLPAEQGKAPSSDTPSP